MIKQCKKKPDSCPEVEFSSEHGGFLYKNKTIIAPQVIEGQEKLWTSGLMALTFCNGIKKLWIDSENKALLKALMDAFQDFEPMSIYLKDSLILPEAETKKRTPIEVLDGSDLSSLF